MPTRVRAVLFGLVSNHAARRSAAAARTGRTGIPRTGAGRARASTCGRGRRPRVRQRVGEAVARQAPMADDDPCAALDPETATCDLYAARPITCRTFGPPVRCESGDLGVCELCFEGASDVEIAACEVEFDPQGLELVLLRELEQIAGLRGETTVAQALA